MNSHITKISLDDCRKLKANPPLWLRVFGDFDNIPAMDETVCDKWYGDSTWHDTSWHNDVCPSFESYDLIAGKAVKIWSDYANEDLRETDSYSQYGMSLWTLDGEGDDMTSMDYIEDILVTDDRADVFNWILKQEGANEMQKQQAEKLKADNKRLATFEDMTTNRKFAHNLSSELADASLVGQCGFIYFDSYYISIYQKTGQFHTIASNDDILTATLVEAELWLWENHVAHEAIEIDLPPAMEFIIVFEYDVVVDPTTKIVNESFFNIDNGYYKSEIKAITELAIGESYDSYDVVGICKESTVYRTR